LTRAGKGRFGALLAPATAIPPWTALYWEASSWERTFMIGDLYLQALSNGEPDNGFAAQFKNRKG
jgi:hypothetical protein